MRSHAGSPVLRKLRLSLTLCLALLLTGVVLIVGTVLGFHTYRQTARRGGEAARPLPATERLLFDAPHQMVERAPVERMPDSNPWGFELNEAHTAADRPYNKGEAISEAIVIMARMRDEQHIDADRFGLFLASGAYRRYAERHLRPEQIDEIDVAAFTARAADRVPENEESR